MFIEKNGGGISYSFIEYATYITFFPQLVAGPIVTHNALVPQLKDENKKDVNFEYMSKGILLFVLGLSKKVLIADVFGNAVNIAYEDVNSLSTLSAIITMLSYTFQIYFDFSGYSDMALGLGWMMNIDLPVNFDSPYKAISVTDFWKRWHMTLTDFFRKYVYIPLGGNRDGEIKTCRNILVIFILSGLWHGAGWTFITWGAMHGIAQVTERFFVKIGAKIHTVFSWAMTFLFINMGWILFRAKSLLDALTVFKKIFLCDFSGISEDMINAFMQPEWKWISQKIAGSFLTQHVYVICLCYLGISFMLVLAGHNAKYYAEKYADKFISAVLSSFLLVWCIFSFSGLSTFLYFNF